jgi:HAD superfamily phosphatase (TIGR01668 family)
MQSFLLAGVPKAKRPLFVPDFTADSVLDVDYKALKELGVKHLLIDLDLTLRKKMTRKLEPATITFLTSMMKNHGFASLNIASNNMLDLSGYASSIQAKVFQPYWRHGWIVRKPNKLFFGRILKTLKAKPSECVMIGDKLHGDIYGGNVSGLHTVLVKPKGHDYWYDRLLLTRFRERRRLLPYLPKPKLKR